MRARALDGLKEGEHLVGERELRGERGLVVALRHRSERVGHALLHQAREHARAARGIEVGDLLEGVIQRRERLLDVDGDRPLVQPR